MTIKRCLIIDTETTGLDPAKDRVIEIGIILYSVEHRCALRSFSTLMHADENPCETINRIPAAALSSLDLPYPEDMVRRMGITADVYVAHNAEFDAGFLQWTDRLWLCTMSDFAWPRATSKAPGLINLALDHGIGVGSAHRALTDCELIASLFTRVELYGANLDEMFAYAMRPKSKFQALVPFEQKDLAKDAGFRWNEDGTKRWLRTMAIEDAAKLGFRTLQLA